MPWIPAYGISIFKYVLVLQEVELEWTPSQCNAVEITQCVLSTTAVIGHQCLWELQQVPCTLSCAARVCVRRQSMLSAVSGAWQFDTALKPSDTQTPRLLYLLDLLLLSECV